MPPTEQAPPVERGLWLIDSTTGDRLRLAVPEGLNPQCWEYDETPQWSPSGQQLAFIWAHDDGDSECEIYLVDVSNLYE
jgi:Tol biopolymer transport system component